MKKELVNKKARRRWSAVATFIVLVTAAMVFFIYQPKESANRFSSVYARLNAWMQDRKTRLNHNLTEVKHLAASQKNTHQEIHFEFYTALPGMRVEMPLEKREGEKVSSAETVHGRLTTETLFDAEKLQQALREEMQEKEDSVLPVRMGGQYIVQVGVFKNLAGAQKFRETFEKTGFETRVVYVNMTRGKAYSVQIGPFAAKNQALQTLHQLQQKNTNGIIRKL